MFPYIPLPIRPYLQVISCYLFLRSCWHPLFLSLGTALRVDIQSCYYFSIHVFIKSRRIIGFGRVHMLQFFKDLIRTHHTKVSIFGVFPSLVSGCIH